MFVHHLNRSRVQIDFERETAHPKYPDDEFKQAVHVSSFLSSDTAREFARFIVSPVLAQKKATESSKSTTIVCFEFLDRCIYGIFKATFVVSKRSKQFVKFHGMSR